MARVAGRKICKTDGCKEAVKRNRSGQGMGYCEEHHNSWVVRVPVSDTSTCKLESCERPVKRNRKGHGMGYCEGHWGSHGRRYVAPGSKYKKRD